MNSPRPVERVMDALDVAKGPDNNGEYVAFCIAHDDRNTPNLHVVEDENGNVLVWCSAGCSQERVLAALEERGVGKADLFANRNVQRAGGCLSPRNRVQPCNPARSKPIPRKRSCRSSGFGSRASQICTIRG